MKTFSQKPYPYYILCIGYINLQHYRNPVKQILTNNRCIVTLCQLPTFGTLGNYFKSQ